MALLEPGHQVARYEVLGRIATGGMSEVYLARQSGPGGFAKTVVLKVILPNLADDPDFIRMFSNEAKLAALLNHPNVVQIFDFGVDDHIHYMAMEYIDGRNLSHIATALKESEQRMPIAVALRVIADACGALEYAHNLSDADGARLDVIHRDVSLENVLVTYGGQIKLVDFGVAKARNLESYTQVGTLKGKYNYMAPEMVEGRPLDSRADLFSMGVVMYQLFTGEQPFTGVNHAMILHQIAYEAPRPPRDVAPDLDPEIERIVLRALEKRPDARYQRAREIQADVEQFMRQTGEALMPHELAAFMRDLFPPGTDPTRETYRQLCGTGAGAPSSAGARTGPATPSHHALRSLATPPQHDRAGWLPDEALATREVASVPTRDPRRESMPRVPQDLPGEPPLDHLDVADDFDDPTRVSFGGEEASPPLDTDPYNGYDPARTRERPALLLDQPDSRPTIVPGELPAATRMPVARPLEPHGTLEGGFGPGSEPGRRSGPEIELPVTEPPPSADPSRRGGAASGSEDVPAGRLDTYPDGIPRTVAPSAEMIAAYRPPSQPIATIAVPLPAPSSEVPRVEAPPRRARRRVMFFSALAAGVFLIAGLVVYLVASSDDGRGRGSARGSVAGGGGGGGSGGGGTAGGSGGSAGARAGTTAAPAADAAPSAHVVKAADASAASATGSGSGSVAGAPDAAAVAIVPRGTAVGTGARPGTAHHRPHRLHPRHRVAHHARARQGLLSVLALGSATVYIDGKRHGLLPMRRLQIEPGSHRVEIRGSSPRYRVVRTVMIKRGVHERLRVVPKQGTLLVRVRPWALVTLDGRRLGTTPLAPIKLFEGPHVIVLENDSIGARAGRRIVIKPGQDKVLKVRLSPHKKRGSR